MTGRGRLTRLAPLGGHELLQEAYQQKLKMNVISFQVHPEGPQAMGWFKKEIRTFNDIKGQRYRIYGIGAEAYSKLGIATVTLPGGEIVPALEPTDELNNRFLQVFDELQAGNAAKDEFYKKVIDSQKKYSGLIVPYRLSYWPKYEFIAGHYYKDKIWLK